MPKISVIVPVYNVEKYLRRCIDSILAQTFTDFELILVDDGSPDSCPAICDEYAVKDSRIVVIHQKNGGLSAARNAGIDWAFSNSNSQYLSFIDSDDYVHPNFLEFLYDAILEHNVQISVCNVERTDKDSIVWEQFYYSSEKKESMQFYMDNTIWATIACNKLYTKEIFKNYRYPVNKLHEDEFLTYKLLYNAKNIVWVTLPLYIYYSNPTSIMNCRTIQSYHDVMLAFEEQMSFWKKNNQFMAYIKSIRLAAAVLANGIKNHKCKKTIKKLRNSLRILLLRYIFVHDITLKRDYYIYESAFPFFSAQYLFFKAVGNKLKKYRQ